MTAPMSQQQLPHSPTNSEYLIRWILRLYPRAWRDRYEDEFLAMLEHDTPTLWDVLDTLRSAYDAQLHYQIRHPDNEGENDMRGVTLAGTGAIATGILIFVLFIAMFMGVEEETLESTMILVPLLLVSLAPAMRRVLREHITPNRLFGVRVPLAGIALLIALTISLLAAFSGNPANRPSYLPTLIISVTLFASMGIWLALVHLRAAHLGRLPLWLCMAGVAAGMSPAIMLYSSILSSINRPLIYSLNGLWSLNILVFFVVMPLWAFGIGAWFLRHKPKQAGAV